MMASGSVGGVDRDILSTPRGEHAFVLGALRIASGQFANQLVVAWSPLEVDSINDALKIERSLLAPALPQDELATTACRRWCSSTRCPACANCGGDRAQEPPARRDGVPDRRSARSRCVHRLGQADAMAAHRHDGRAARFGLVAMVLADGGTIRGSAQRRVDSRHGLATEPASSATATLEAAVARRGARAGLRGGRRANASSFDVAEVADGTPYQELLAYEGLGICARDAWSKQVASGAYARGGKLPVNLSGGALSFNPLFCAGLVRIAEAANQVRGAAGEHQVEGAKTALAMAYGANSQYFSMWVVVMEGGRA
jgi:acetyl-CoA C-acetyltransferase